MKFNGNISEGSIIFGSENVPYNASSISNNIVKVPNGKTVAAIGIVLNGGFTGDLAENILISNNIIDHGSIDVWNNNAEYPSNNLTISGNTINATGVSTAASTAGIVLVYVDGVLVVGNTIYNSTGHGIWMRESQHAHVVGNIINGSTGYAYHSSGSSDYNYISGNNFRDNTSGAYDGLGANDVLVGNYDSALPVAMTYGGISPDNLMLNYARANELSSVTMRSKNAANVGGVDWKLFADADSSVLPTDRTLALYGYPQIPSNGTYGGSEQFMAFSFPTYDGATTYTKNTRITSDVINLLSGGGAVAVGIDVYSPTAAIHIKPGSIGAGTAPLKFSSGPLMATPEAGAIEFLTDSFYGTSTTSPTRNTFAMLEKSQVWTADQTIYNVNLVLSTITGTKIGTTPTQKLGFYNATPIVQPTGDVIAALTNLGLVATPTITATTNANLTGVITSSGNATSIASQTGTGTKFVMDTSPTLVTPNIGAATGTSLALTNTSATGLVVGANGSTNPAFAVDSSTASMVTGLLLKSAASGGGLALSVTSTASNETLNINSKGSTGPIVINGVAGGPVNIWGVTTFNQNIVLSTKNLVTDTTTGTKIGTATNQELGFYNSTPIVQPATTGTTTGFTAGSGTAINDASTFTGGSGSTAYRVSDVVLALKQLGLLTA